MNAMSVLVQRMEAAGRDSDEIQVLKECVGLVPGIVESVETVCMFFFNQTPTSEVAL